MSEYKSSYYPSLRISSEFKDCALPLTFDTMNRCSFGCKYCFGVQFKECHPAYKDKSIKPINSKIYCKIFEGKYPLNPYYNNFLKHRFIFHIGGLNDPYCYYEKKFQATLELLKTLSELKYPTLFSTKGLSLYLDNKEYIEIFEKSSPYKHFAFQFSIVSNNDKISNLIEPHTPSTTDRFKSMKKMSNLGYWCILRLRPFIIGITDIELEELLQKAKDNGARAISMEFFALDARVVSMLQPQLDVMSKIIGFDIVEYYKKLSPPERGGYMRLNRNVKEYYMYRLVKTCKKLGLQINVSDPDFKELNESPCCCGMPNEYKDNPEMLNYSRGQITGVLIDLKKRYWQSEGTDKYLNFEAIDVEVANRWYEEKKYYGDSIKKWNTNYFKMNHSHKTEFIESWNNLRSPDNPYNHYHNLLIPDHIENNRIVFRYNPQPYELRWKKEGLI